MTETSLAGSEPTPIGWPEIAVDQTTIEAFQAACDSALKQYGRPTNTGGLNVAFGDSFANVHISRCQRGEATITHAHMMQDLDTNVTEESVFRVVSTSDATTVQELRGPATEPYLPEGKIVDFTWVTTSIPELQRRFGTRRQRAGAFLLRTINRLSI